MIFEIGIKIFNSVLKEKSWDERKLHFGKILVVGISMVVVASTGGG